VAGGVPLEKVIWLVPDVPLAGTEEKGALSSMLNGVRNLIGEIRRIEDAR
jgi:hypothetical protein